MKQLTHLIKLMALALAATTILIQAQARAAETPDLAQLETLSNEELQNIYTTEMSKGLSQLGKHCLLKSQSELEALENQMTDPDLKMSDDEFKQYLTKDGIGMYPFEPQVPSVDNCFMNSREYFALRAYTGSTYSTLNRALREKQKSVLEKYRIFIKFLNSALMKFLPYTQFVKRGTSLMPSQIQDHLKGAEVVYNSYTSTSVANGFNGSVRFVILSRSCRYIAPFSKFQSEEEVICLPGTKFKVVYREDAPGVIKILMSEIGQQMDIDQFVSEIP